MQQNLKEVRWCSVSSTSRSGGWIRLQRNIIDTYIHSRRSAIRRQEGGPRSCGIALEEARRRHRIATYSVTRQRGRVRRGRRRLDARGPEVSRARSCGAMANANAERSIWVASLRISAWTLNSVSDICEHLAVDVEGLAPCNAPLTCTHDVRRTLKLRAASSTSAGQSSSVARAEQIPSPFSPSRTSHIARRRGARKKPRRTDALD